MLRQYTDALPDVGTFSGSEEDIPLQIPLPTSDNRLDELRIGGQMDLFGDVQK